MTSTFRRERDTIPVVESDGIRGANYRLMLLVLGVVLLLTLRQTLIVPYTGVGLPPAQLIFLGCALLWLLRFFSGATTGHILGGFVALQVCALLSSYAAAYTHSLTPEQSLNATHSLLQYVIVAMLIIFVMDTLRCIDDVAVLMRWTVGAGAVAATIALVTAISGIDLSQIIQLPGLRVGMELLPRGLLREGLMRAQGTAQHPLELGAVMAFLTPLALTCAVDSRCRGRSMIPWLLATVLIIGAALYSLSRSAVFTSVVGILVMMMFWPLRRSLRTIAVLCVATAAILLSGFGVVSALISSVQGASSDRSLASRAIGRAYVLSHLQDNPWFGQGIGTYANRVAPVLDNQYFGYVIESGFCGLIAALLLTIAPLVLAIRVRSLADQRRRDLVGGVAGSLVIVALIQTVLDTAAFIQFSTLTALGVGILGALSIPAFKHQNGLRPGSHDPAGTHTIRAPNRASHSGSNALRTAPCLMTPVHDHRDGGVIVLSFPGVVWLGF